MGSTEPLPSRQQRLSRSAAVNNYEQPATPVSSSNFRPVGIAEPLRRMSGTVIVRPLKNASIEGDKSTEKSVQVNTIIRSCGRCAGSSLSPATGLMSVKKHCAISVSSSQTGDLSSGCESDDASAGLQAPNMDRLRQRRATLVAKTIINQMATQLPVASVDEPMPPSIMPTGQRLRPIDVTPSTVKFSVRSTSSASPDTPRKNDKSQEEFLEISKQISSLLTTNNDEH